MTYYVLKGVNTGMYVKRVSKVILHRRLSVHLAKINFQTHLCVSGMEGKFGMIACRGHGRVVVQYSLCSSILY